MSVFPYFTDEDFKAHGDQISFLGNETVSKEDQIRDEGQSLHRCSLTETGQTETFPQFYTNLKKQEVKCGL